MGDELTRSCSLLNVDVVEGDAFLGRGTYGCVFKVIGQDREVLALKIAEDIYVEYLHQEKEALMKAQHTGLTINPVGKVVETRDGAALLLSPVGRPLPEPTTHQEVRNLFELLWQLHANDVVHGDARWHNVIVTTEGKLLWIDLSGVLDACPQLKQIDAETLTLSILNIRGCILRDPVLEKMVNDYGNNTTRENLNRLAEKVCLTRRVVQ